jgi:hypothetical protein
VKLEWTSFMSYTLWSSIEKYRKDVVDLDPDETTIAKASRDFLFTQLTLLDVNNKYIFPKLYKDPMPYGSFARKTKIRPLDDIDLLLLLDGTGTVSGESSYVPYSHYLRIADEYSVLAPYGDSSSDHVPGFYGFVNSVKVLNAIKSGLSKVTHYKKAEIRRNQEAIVLNLTSYDWKFDVVPTVPIRDKAGDIAYYLIPNGSGAWMRTDPRKDAARLTSINQQHSVSIQCVIRLLKRWNQRTTKPRLGSYYFEALCLNVFNHARCLSGISESVEYFFLMCPHYLWQRCPDPKGLGPDLDAKVDLDVKGKVETAMRNAYLLAS